MFCHLLFLLVSPQPIGPPPPQGMFTNVFVMLLTLNLHLFTISAALPPHPASFDEFLIQSHSLPN